MKKDILGYRFNDNQTRKIIKKVYAEFNYILDPHGAIGYMGLKKYFKSQTKSTGIFLETAHPIKFAETIEKKLKIKVEIPKSIDFSKQTVSSKLMSNYDDLKSFLLQN